MGCERQTQDQLRASPIGLAEQPGFLLESRAPHCRQLRTQPARLAQSVVCAHGPIRSPLSQQRPIAPHRHLVPQYRRRFARKKRPGDRRAVLAGRRRSAGDLGGLVQMALQPNRLCGRRRVVRQRRYRGRTRSRSRLCLQPLRTGNREKKRQSHRLDRLHLGLGASRRI